MAVVNLANNQYVESVIERDRLVPIGEAQLTRVNEFTVLVVPGLLGSGKTTLCSQLWERYGELHGENRAAIILTEVASNLNADVERYPEGTPLSSLNGCACCSTLNETVLAARRFKEQGYELVIVEPSGRSKGINIVEGLRQSNIGKVSAISLVDTRRLRRDPETLLSNIGCADLLVINHCPDTESENRACLAVKELTAALPADLRGRNVPSVVHPQRDLMSTSLWETVLRGGTQRFTPDKNPKKSGLTPIVLEVWPAVDSAQVSGVLASLLKSGITVERARGRIGAKDVDWTLGDNGKLHHTESNTLHPSSVWGEKPHIIMFLSEVQDWLTLTATLARVGGPRLSDETLRDVYANYPRLEAQKEALLRGAGITLEFDADEVLKMVERFLTMLVKQDPGVKSELITKAGPEYVNHLQRAWTFLKGLYCEYRSDLLREIGPFLSEDSRRGVIPTEELERLPGYVFRLCYDLLDQASNAGPNSLDGYQALKTDIIGSSSGAASHASLYDRVAGVSPATLMLFAVGSAPNLKPESLGFRDLEDSEASANTLITGVRNRILMAARLGRLPALVQMDDPFKRAVDAALKNVEALVETAPQWSPWKEFLLKFRQ